MRMNTPKALRKINDDSLLKRIMDKVEKVGDCWLWKGYCDDKGYGQIWYRGRAYWVHKISYALFVGNIMRGDHIHHGCENANCIAPHHLSTMQEKEHNKYHLSGNRNGA